jgi:hypothetical protein
MTIYEFRRKFELFRGEDSGRIDMKIIEIEVVKQWREKEDVLERGLKMFRIEFDVIFLWFSSRKLKNFVEENVKDEGQYVDYVTFEKKKRLDKALWHQFQSLLFPSKFSQ